jgi:endonuclease/exonuclease/phosphatase family metal-dependent hydrolase
MEIMMKKYLLKALLGLVLLPNTLAITATSLEVMSRNVRRFGDDPVQYQWDNRKQRVFDQILERKPAVIGFQEVVEGKQFDDLKNGLPAYKSFGEPRNNFVTGWYQRRVTSLDKAKNECNPIFYDPNQVELIDSGTAGINPYGRLMTASLPRMYTWGLFKDKENGKMFYLYNTHLSSSGAWGLKDGTELIRTRQIKMILKDINKKKAPKTPTILMGDFNTKFEGKMKKKITKAGFVHAKEKAKVAKGPEATRTGWNDEQLKVIDHIFVKGTDVAEYEVIVSPKGEYPSDHRPVCAKVVFE